MTTEVTINGGPGPTTNYVGWAPVPAQIRLMTPVTGSTAPVQATLRNRNPRVGGQVVFLPDRSTPGTPELQLTLPADGSPVHFFVAGRFGKSSTRDRDAAIRVVEAGSSRPSSTTTLMVRIRKDANSLTRAERDRFLDAIATLNDRGMGRFSDFRNVHTSAGSPEAHGDAGFLPWHRAYLLDLERELQAIDPSVALPYWRFDRPAPKVFVRAFLGVPDAATATLAFSPDNPLQFWATDGVPGIVRRPQFDPATGFADVIDELGTMQLGEASNRYLRFRRLEGNPHGWAHTSFTGFISDIPTAARDPLFFMLHANVDRLWAKWQWLNRRFDVTSTLTYSHLGAAGSAGATRIGHNLKDTMWPWNGVTGGQRPPTAPGGQFPPSVMTAAPGPTPKVGALIDYQGVLTPETRVGFDYDDVPFEVS